MGEHVGDYDVIEVRGASVGHGDLVDDLIATVVAVLLVLDGLGQINLGGTDDDLGLGGCFCLFTLDVLASHCGGVVVGVGFCILRSEHVGCGARHVLIGCQFSLRALEVADLLVCQGDVSQRDLGGVVHIEAVFDGFACQRLAFDCLVVLLDFGGLGQGDGGLVYGHLNGCGLLLGHDVAVLLCVVGSSLALQHCGVVDVLAVVDVLLVDGVFDGALEACAGGEGELAVGDVELRCFFSASFSVERYTVVKGDGCFVGKLAVLQGDIVQGDVTGVTAGDDEGCCLFVVANNAVTECVCALVGRAYLLGEFQSGAGFNDGDNHRGRIRGDDLALVLTGDGCGVLQDGFEVDVFLSDLAPSDGAGVLVADCQVCALLG